MTLPDPVRNMLLSPTGGIGMEQLWILVSFFVLQRHNLFLLRIHRKDYLLSARRRLSFLPQGDGQSPFAPARDRMLVLAESILSQLQPGAATTSGAPRAGRAAASDAAAPRSAAAAGSPAGGARLESPAARAQACAAIGTLVRYLKESSMGSSQVCDVSDICQAAMDTCKPLERERSVELTFAGRQRWLPLRVLLVDDQAYVLKRLQRLARNRGYHYECCTSVESCVRAFEASLKGGGQGGCGFDVIVMDKEMPMGEQGGKEVDPTAGAAAVRRIRQLSLLQAEQQPGFRHPCIIGNTACTDEDDATLVQLRGELALARQQAGMRDGLLVLPAKMSSWSDDFDAQVRRLCGMQDAAPAAGDPELQAPTVWGNPMRLQMIFYNLITNAITHGRPAAGQHRVRVSYDVVDSRARLHPCLMRLDRDDEVERSMSWQLSGAFDAGAQWFVQVMVADNGPGIDVHNERMRRSLGLQLPSAGGGGGGGGGAAAAAAGPAAGERGGAGASAPGGSSVSNLGIGLQRVVCPEVANSHGAMGVHSRSEPHTGCTFVVALPLCKTG